MSRRRAAAPRPHSAPSRRSPEPSRPPVDRRIVRAGAAALGLAALALYAATAARDIVLGDSAEFVTIAATLGVAHPPGYPLLSLLGHALTWLPVGPIAFRANLLSALAGAGTVVVVFLTAVHVTRDWIGAAMAAALLAVHPLVWEWSLVIEAFMLNAFFATLGLYGLLRWDGDPERRRWFLLAAAAGALGVANHPTIIAVLPAALVVMWRRRDTLRAHPAWLAAAGAIALGGLSLYAYLPWAAARHPFLNWGSVASLGHVVHHFLRTTYGTFQLTANGGGTAAQRFGVFLGSFTAVETVLVLAGAAIAFVRHRVYASLAVLTALVAGPGFVAASNLDVNQPGFGWVLLRFAVLPHAVLAPLASVALAAIVAGAMRLFSLERAWIARAAVGAGGLALVLALAVAGYPAANQRNNHLARQFAEDVLRTVPPDGVLIADSDAVVLPVAYLQAVEGARPDVTVLMVGPLTRGAWYISQIRERQPRLVVPFDQYMAAAGATIRAILDANPARPFILIGAPPDQSLEPAYWFLPHGLGFQLVPSTRDVALVEVGRENDRLFAAYHPPDPSVASRINFDGYVLRAYSTGACQVGQQFAGSQALQDARAWFFRAVTIDPSDPAARALAGVR